MIVTPDSTNFDKYLKPPVEQANVHAPTTYVEQVKALFDRETEGYGYVLPWAKTHEKIRVRPSEVSIWAGINGHGKSLLLSQVILGLMRQGAKVCLASFEMTPAATLHRMVQQAASTEMPSIAFIDAFHDWADQKLFLYDQKGTVKTDRVYALMRYANKELGCDQMVIDSMMKCGLHVNEGWDSQKDFMDTLTSIATDTGMHVHLVAHSKKQETERQRMDKMGVKGAGELTDMVDNLYLVHRNKAKEESLAKGKTDKADEADTYLANDKQRNGRPGSEGTYRLWLDRRSGAFVEVPGKRSAPMPLALANQEADAGGEVVREVPF